MKTLFLRKKMSLSSPVKFDALLHISKKQEEPDPGGEVKRIVEGNAIVAKNIDEQFDVIDVGALGNAVGYLKKYKTVLFNHDPNRPVGKILDAEVREDKIWVQVQISKAEDDLWGKIIEDIVNSFSLSGEIDDFEFKFDKKLNTQVRIIKAFRVHEISLVSVPANPEAKTLSAYLTKSLDKAGYDRESYVEDEEKHKKFLKELEFINIAMEVTKAMNWKEKLQQAIKSIGELSSKIEDTSIQDSLKNIQKLLTDVLTDVSKDSDPNDDKSLIELKNLISELEKKFADSNQLSQSSVAKVDDLEKKISDVDSAVVGLTEIIKELIDSSDDANPTAEEIELEKAKKILQDAGINPNLIGASS